MADEAQLKVRLLRTLKAKVDAAAHENRRTLNAEIAARLERTFIEDAERSGLAKERILSARLTGAEAKPSGDNKGASDVDKRVANLEKGLAALLGAIADLENRLSRSTDSDPSPE